MTRFVEKIILYYDKFNSSRIVVRIKLDYSENCFIILDACLEDVEIDLLGKIIHWTTRFSYKSSLNSWQRYLNRRYPSRRFKKEIETYIY